MFGSWIITRAPEIQENTRLMYKGSGEHEETGHDVFWAFRASYGIGQRLYIDNKLLLLFFCRAEAAQAMIHFIITHDHIKECSISSLAPFVRKKCAIPP